MSHFLESSVLIYETTSSSSQWTILRVETSLKITETIAVYKQLYYVENSSDKMVMTMLIVFIDWWYVE